MNLQNKNQGRFCRTDGHFLDLAQLKLRTLYWGRVQRVGQAWAWIGQNAA